MKLRFALGTSLAASFAVSASACSGKDYNTHGPSCTMATSPASVPIVMVAAAPPVPQGGTVTPGTYVLTDYTTYTGANGMAGPAGTSLSGAVFFDTMATTAFKSWLSTGTPSTVSGNYGVSATTLKLFLTCPKSIVDHVQFTATPTTLQMFNAGAGGATIVSTYTLQCQAGAFPGMGC